MTNALGQVWTYDYYDAAGRLIQMTDPDGLVHTYSYDARGRVASATDFRAVPWSVRGVSYTYTPAGQVWTASFFPENLLLTYTYDAAWNLRSITDSLGNRATYAYDTRGNRTTRYTNDPDGALSTFLGEAYDRRNARETVSRWRSFSAPAAITGYVNDATGNLLQEIDPNQSASPTPKATVHRYDALSRLVETLDALTGRTAYGYDVGDRLTRVTAPNQANTTYAYDDLGNLLSETSPDRGTTTYTHDAAGNRQTATDARNITVSYSYDALNRLTGIDYPGTEEDVTYTYDSGAGCTRGIGRLCRVTDEAGTETYAYDAFGNLLTTTRTVFGRPYTTQTTRDARGRLTSLIYPGGRTATYTRDALGRITRITATVNGQVQTLVSNIAYRADHRVKTRTFGNGMVETRVHFLDGTVQEQYLGSADTRLYGYDRNGNLTQLQSLPRVADFGYDALDRLTADPDPATFTYDPNGNRKTETRNTTTTAYTYPAAGNRLTGVGGTVYQYDPAGNLTGAGGRGYTYAGSGRLRMGLTGGALTGYYRYAHTGLRLQKFSWATGWRVHHYAPDSKLLQETTDTGSLVRAYVWDDEVPIAQIDRDPTTGQETLAYLHTDYLGTPRLATNSQQAVVWRWEGNAFGETPPSGSITVNLRFAGQYYDAETGLHYNWHRYYDPRIGRYITADPRGVRKHVHFAFVQMQATQASATKYGYLNTRTCK